MTLLPLSRRLDIAEQLLVLGIFEAGTRMGRLRPAVLVIRGSGSAGPPNSPGSANK